MRSDAQVACRLPDTIADAEEAGDGENPVQTVLRHRPPHQPALPVPYLSNAPTLYRGRAGTRDFARKHVNFPAPPAQ